MVSSLAGREREMLARGFALAFKGIDVVVVHVPYLESCICNVTLMLSCY